MNMNTFKSAATQTVDVGDATFSFRKFGLGGGVPLVFLHHFTAVLDDWDPKTLDGIAAGHQVVVFDSRGVGGSSGSTPQSVAEMATDAIAFISALGFDKVDLFGFSLGGFVAQAIIHARPDLVRRAVLAGTGPSGGQGIANTGAVVQAAIATTAGTERHPKHVLFFTQTSGGQAAASAYLRRLDERTEDRDAQVSNETTAAQLTAIQAWGNGAPTALETIERPVFVANGDTDIMVPTTNSVELAARIPNARLSIFPDSGHGGVFEHHTAFVPQVLAFLRD